MFKSFTTTAVGTLLLLAGTSSADEHYSDTGIRTFGSRSFAVGTTPPTIRESEWILAFSDYPELAAIRDADPILANVSVSFRRIAVSFSEIHLDDQKLSEMLLLDDSSPWSIDGYETRRVPIERNARITYIDDLEPLVHVVKCAQYNDSNDFLTCDVNVAYPFDKNIQLLGRWTWPRPTEFAKSHFDDIALRLLEVALCLDVTNDPRILDENLLDPEKMLLDCRELLTS